MHVPHRKTLYSLQPNAQFTPHLLSSLIRDYGQNSGTIPEHPLRSTEPKAASDPTSSQNKRFTNE